jgi:hypothetical protein
MLERLRYNALPMGGQMHSGQNGIIIKIGKKNNQQKNTLDD